MSIPSEGYAARADDRKDEVVRYWVDEESGVVHFRTVALTTGDSVADRLKLACDIAKGASEELPAQDGGGASAQTTDAALHVVNAARALFEQTCSVKAVNLRKALLDSLEEFDREVLAAEEQDDVDILALPTVEENEARGYLIALLRVESVARVVVGGDGVRLTGEGQEVAKMTGLARAVAAADEARRKALAASDGGLGLFVKPLALIEMDVLRALAGVLEVASMLMQHDLNGVEWTWEPLKGQIAEYGRLLTGKNQEEPTQ